MNQIGYDLMYTLHPESDCGGSSYVATYRCQDVFESVMQRGSNV
jgi:hypothetical protein